MSFTETISCKTRTTSILRLNSPEKKKDNKESPTNETTSSASTPEILKWIFRHDSIASCFVKDVFDLQEDSKGDFFWLGRVPCRTVRIVGLIVGVVQRDDNTRYSSESAQLCVTYTPLTTSGSRRREWYHRLLAKARKATTNAQETWKECETNVCEATRPTATSSANS